MNPNRGFVSEDAMTDSTLRVRRSDERGVAEHGWLSSRHSFSFANYYDPEHMGFGALRVINDDRVRPGQGFGTHPHQDMEILSFVVEGELEHRDSLGNGSVIRPGDVQRMSAGTGILHSEFNPSQTDPVRFLQVWIEPESRGLAPGYEQRAFPLGEQPDRLVLVGSRDGRDGSLTVHQDVSVYRAHLSRGGSVEHRMVPGRHLWLQVVSGELEAAGQRLAEGDGLGISDADTVEITGLSESTDVILFDLA
jgi:redox-sensitive bicupin YhaK (pirin superfamily)